MNCCSLEKEMLMSREVHIRFVGEPGTTSYFLKLGPMNASNPPERQFKGGDEMIVQLEDTPGTTDCVDITFEDGAFALEVPSEMFIITRDTAGG
jgi:hypothetical protein